MTPPNVRFGLFPFMLNGGFYAQTGTKLTQLTGFCSGLCLKSAQLVVTMTCFLFVSRNKSGFSPRFYHFKACFVPIMIIFLSFNSKTRRENELLIHLACFSSFPNSSLVIGFSKGSNSIITGFPSLSTLTLLTLECVTANLNDS